MQYIVIPAARLDRSTAELYISANLTRIIRYLCLYDSIYQWTNSRPTQNTIQHNIALIVIETV